MRIHAPVTDSIAPSPPPRRRPAGSRLIDGRAKKGRRLVDRRQRLLFLASTFVFLCLWARLFPHTGDGDAILHYLSARDAFAFPKGFLSPWARWGALWPIILPAQLGIFPARCVMAGVSTVCLWQTMRMADDLRLRPAALAGAFVILQPLVFALAADTMTEIPMALLMTVAVRLWWARRYRLSCLAASFLPAVRPEGFVLLPFWLAMLAAVQEKSSVRSKFRDPASTPLDCRQSPLSFGAPPARFLLPAGLLFTGLFVWTLLAALVAHDSLYVLNSWNWPVQSFPAYGRGAIWHHVIRWPIYCGPVLFPLFLVGIRPSLKSAARFVLRARASQTKGPSQTKGSGVFDSLRKRSALTSASRSTFDASQRRPAPPRSRLTNSSRPTMLLPLTLWLTFFLLHTLFYWQGLFASVGLMRIFASTSPFTALICLHGWIAARRWLNNRARPRASRSPAIKLLTTTAAHPRARSRLPHFALLGGALPTTVLAAAALSVLFYYFDNPEHFRFVPLADAAHYITDNHLLDRAPAVFLGDPIAIADLDLPPQPSVMLNSCSVYEQRTRLRHLPPGAIGIWDNQHAQQWFNLSIEDVQNLGFKILYQSCQTRHSLLLYRTAKTDGLQRYAVLQKTSPIE